MPNVIAFDIGGTKIEGVLFNRGKDTVRGLLGHLGIEEGRLTMSNNTISIHLNSDQKWS